MQQPSRSSKRKIVRYFSNSSSCSSGSNSGDEEDSSFHLTEDTDISLNEETKKGKKRAAIRKPSEKSKKCNLNNKSKKRSRNDENAAAKENNDEKKRVEVVTDSDASSFVFTDSVKEASHSKRKRCKAPTEENSLLLTIRKRKRKSFSVADLRNKKKTRKEKEDAAAPSDFDINRKIKTETEEEEIKIKEEKMDEDYENVRVKEEKELIGEHRKEEYQQEKHQQPIRIKTEAGCAYNVNAVAAETGTTIIKNEEYASVKMENDYVEKKRYKLGSGIEWEASMLADYADMDFWLAKSIINLFRNECTVPFIARYRREYTNNMDADNLRQLKETYEHIKALEAKANIVRKQIEKVGKLTRSIDTSIAYVKSFEELQDIHAPFKRGSSKSKAERAKALGLEEVAQMVLNGSGGDGDGGVIFRPHDYVDSSKEELRNTNQVVENVQNIMADVYAKDEDVLGYIHSIENTIHIVIKSTKTKTCTSKGKKKDEQNYREDVEEKFKNYYEFEKDIKYILPHQILALNRGESQKILSVKVLLTDSSFYNGLYAFCKRKWLCNGLNYNLRFNMFDASFRDSYNRLICPLIVRRVKAKLNRKAQQIAIQTFASNLKNLLRTRPIKGCTILGVDPGIKHGVKFALISATGELLWRTTLKMNLNSDLSGNAEQMNVIKEQMFLHRCELIALGNGTGCRLVERIISDCVKTGFFLPKLNVRYTIVNERGASIYSCSAIAKEEFPNLDPNLISAVFIARSLQDPLSELVKVEPKHLGVGMYQHDMPEKQLNQTLDEVVIECVSFVGVDVNAASLHLLKRVAGLNNVKASNIIEWRRKNGSFVNREELLSVKGIGQKTFEQCSGFMRIHPKTTTTSYASECAFVGENSKKGRTINPLDNTEIHPESYAIAYRFLEECNLKLSDLGTDAFVNRISSIVQTKEIKTIAAKLRQSEDLVSSMADALSKPNDYDYRSKFNEPVFHNALTSMEDLKTGITLRGCVTNVTNFGAFVDIGVGRNGLIHVSKMNRMVLQVGDRVQVEVINVEIERGRISLFLKKKL